MLKIVFKGNPATKKNSMKIVNGGRRLIQSDRYREYEQACLWQVPESAKRHIETPVNLCCVYYRADNRKCDLVNLLGATQDILTRAGVLADDNRAIVLSVDGSRVYTDKVNPRVEIEITAFNP